MGAEQQGTTRRMSQPAAPPDVGAVVGSRYSLLRRLGKGGYGEVWEARDALSAEPVALKLILRDGLQAARVRREIAALRMLRLPGVVRLFDEGTHQGKPFLVMERIDGTPFPGPAVPMTWDALADTTFGLLETLGRIHGAGIVHRDLKPANVLVDAAGRPVVLDFGLSAGMPLGATLTEEGAIVGTPAYLAPEQLFAEPVGPWTDLYSVGLLLYEALAGRLPHVGVDDARASLRARVTQRPRPLAELAPGVPTRVADAVDRLLSVEPRQRPRSADELLRALRGDAASGARPLVRVGVPTLADLAELAATARPIDVVGAPGTGRTRLLADLAAAIERRGGRVARTAPADAPFQSLEPIVGALPPDANLDEAFALVAERLAAVREEGAVVLVDDVERLDRWSAIAIARARPAGLCVVSTRAPSSPDPAPGPGGDAGAAPLRLELGACSEVALRGLFLGPDRIFHLAEDGARVLFDRTGGVAARVADELAAWERARLARIVDGRVSIDREAIERLASALDGGVELLGPTAARGAAVAPRATDQLAWLRLAWPHTRPDLLAQAQSEATWRLEAELSDLVEAGLARRLPDGRVQPLAGANATAAWTADRLAAAHRRLAALLGSGTEGRLLHLVASQDDTRLGDAEAIADEACAFARRAAEQGQLARAVAALSEGVLALGHGDAPALVDARWRLLSLWAEVALVDSTPGTLDRVLYEICRVEPRVGALPELEQLVRAGLEDAWKGQSTSSHLVGLGPFEEPGLEHRRQMLRVRAARRRSLDDEERLLDELEVWGRERGGEAQLALRNWRGGLRYRQSRYDEAAELHDEVARLSRWATARLSARLNGASALLEASRLDEAAAWARLGRDAAAECRLPFFEARAEWILRAARYRAGEIHAVDDELVAAVGRLGVADLDALVHLTEGAVAWRAGDARAAELASHAAQRFQDAGNVPGTVLAAALAHAAAPDPARGRALAARGAELGNACIKVQVLGLLARSGTEVVVPDHLAEAVERERPRRLWAERMELVSVDEALAALRAAPGVA